MDQQNSTAVQTMTDEAPQSSIPSSSDSTPQQAAPAQEYIQPIQDSVSPQAAPAQEYTQPQYSAPPQYAPPIQQGGYAAPLYQNPPPQQMYSYPSPNQVGAKESFVGINLLSKIGVIFIIIGVIAFSAVSEDFLSPLIRTVIIFALGVVMTALGEVFYRISSVTFARALTIGGIGELAISVLIGYTEYGSLNEISSLIIAAVIAAGGTLLSLRYKSQTIMAASTLCGFLPCIITIKENLPLLLTMLYLLLFQTAAVIVCEKKKWHITTFFIEGSNLIMATAFFVALSDSFIDELSAVLISVAYVVVSTLIPITASVISGFRNNGTLTSVSMASFIVSATIQMLLSPIFFLCAETDVFGFGFLALFIACAYFAVAAVANTTFDRCPLVTTLMVSGIICLGFAIPTLFRYGMITIAFHVYAAALFILGSIRKDKAVTICGILACIAAEYLFLNLGILNIGEKVFILQFGINALLWLVIMAVQAIRRNNGATLTAYSILTMLNAVLFCLYLIIDLLSSLDDKDIIAGFGEIMSCFMLFSAFVWMIAAFITGKLRFLGKAAPVTAVVFYCVAICGIGLTNFFSSISSPSANIVCLISSIVVNVISVAAVLDATLAVKSLSPKFAKAVGLLVSLYAMLCVTFTLSANDIVAFTNCIISIIYLAMAIIWIIWGFARRNAVMRRFGLALTLLASAKLFLLDFSEIGAVARTLMFILFGIVLLTVSFIYAIFENKLKKQQQAELYQQQLQYYNYYNSVNQNNPNNPPQ